MRLEAHGLLEPAAGPGARRPDDRRPMIELEAGEEVARGGIRSDRVVRISLQQPDLHVGGRVAAGVAHGHESRRLDRQGDSARLEGRAAGRVGGRDEVIHHEPRFALTALGVDSPRVGNGLFDVPVSELHHVAFVNLVDPDHRGVDRILAGRGRLDPLDDRRALDPRQVDDAIRGAARACARQQHEQGESDSHWTHDSLCPRHAGAERVCRLPGSARQGIPVHSGGRNRRPQEERGPGRKEPSTAGRHGKAVGRSRCATRRSVVVHAGLWRQPACPGQVPACPASRRSASARIRNIPTAARSVNASRPSRRKTAARTPARARSALPRASPTCAPAPRSGGRTPPRSRLRP